MKSKIKGIIHIVTSLLDVLALIGILYAWVLLCLLVIVPKIIEAPPESQFEGLMVTSFIALMLFGPIYLVFRWLFLRSSSTDKQKDVVDEKH